MIVGWHINDGNSDQLAHAHIKVGELLDKNYHIYFGGDINEQNRIYKYEPHRAYKNPLEKYDTVPTYLEDFCEGLITHEFIHVLLFDITGSLNAVTGFDDVDKDEEICAPGFWGSEL